MSVEVPPINASEIRYILENPWSISKFEWMLEGAGGIEDSLIRIASKLNLAKQDGYYKSWRTDQNIPIAFLACYRINEGKYETLFVASKEFESCAMKISREIREILIEQSLNFPGCTCVLYSISEHPKQIAWFRFLGFSYVPSGNIGNSRYFEFKAISPQPKLTE